MALRRVMVWAESESFQGWTCSECAWTFKPSGLPMGESLEEMKRHFESQRDKELPLIFAPSIRERNRPTGQGRWRSL
jgi:hypothetical protein